MKELGHLQSYRVTLTTQAPLFIGSGKAYGKKEYILTPGTRRVTILNTDKFLNLLVEKGLADDWEAFVLGGDARLYDFLKACGVTQGELDGVTAYSVSVGDALDDIHTLTDIQCFIRNAAGQVYLPGSSLKGALRTVLLTNRILERETVHPGVRLDEGAYFHTLACATDRDGRPKNDAVNSILRGILVSDSEPVPDNKLMLGIKTDADVDGNTHDINLCRECIAPGVNITFRVTLDQSVLKGSVTRETLLNAMEKFTGYYGNYLSYFNPPQNYTPVPVGAYLLLGGGAGYFTKTVTYPLYGDEGLRKTVETLSKAFRKHRHEEDMELGISPHMTKWIRYNNVLYPVGLCKVEIQ